MLKIKDNVDLKELEKYRFVLEEIDEELSLYYCYKGCRIFIVNEDRTMTKIIDKIGSKPYYEVNKNDVEALGIADLVEKV